MVLNEPHHNDISSSPVAPVVHLSPTLHAKLNHTNTHMTKYRRRHIDITLKAAQTGVKPQHARLARASLNPRVATVPGLTIPERTIMETKNLEGTKVPDVTFRTRVGSDWKAITTQDLFGGKRVVVFSLPGAFTPTCSTAHVPRYNELAAEFAKHGISDVLCVSVNDTFVMNAWKEDQAADHVTFVPDGNGEFTEKMGLLVDKRELGFGPRSWRYAMVVNDGTIEKMFIEPEKPGDPYEVSDADTVLAWVSGGKAKVHDVMLFTKPGCGHCARAKALLQDRNVAFTEVDSTPGMLRAVSGRATTPQVFVDGQHVGGADELEARIGELV